MNLSRLNFAFSSIVYVQPGEPANYMLTLEWYL